MQAALVPSGPAARRCGSAAMRIRPRRSSVLFSLVLTLLSAGAADARVVRNGAACEGWAHAPALALHGTIAAFQLRGRFDELIDARGGRVVRRWRWAGLGAASGSDGATAWAQDRSGTAHRFDAAHARQVAATDAWLERRGWCAADALRAKEASP